MGRSCFLRVDLRLVDALHAVGALFHHAAAAHGDVGVAPELQARRRPVLIEQEVEAADLVRAVVRAVARADTAVVDHVVQPFVGVHRRADRTHHFARRVLALHAGNGLEVGLGVVDRAAVVGVDADPVHFTAGQHLLFADHGNVVLRLAADDARVAADARVHVDGHAPLVPFVLDLRIKGEGLRGRFVAFLQRGGVAEKFVARDGAHLPASFHQVVVLRAGKRVTLAGGDDVQPRAKRHRVGRAQRVGVEPRAVARLPGARPPVTEMHRGASVGVTGHDKHRALHAAAAVAKLHDVADDLPVLPALHGGRSAHLEQLGRFRAHQHRVVPCEPGDGLRQLLQPAVVGEAPVEHGRIAAELDLERRRCGRRR